MRHRNKATSVVGVRKHRGKRVRGGLWRKRSKSLNNSLHPSLQPTGAFNSRIDNFMDGQKRYYDSEGNPVEERAAAQGGSEPSPQTERSSFNARPKHWPPQSRRHNPQTKRDARANSSRSKIKRELRKTLAQATLTHKLVKNRDRASKKQFTKALVGGNGGTVGFMPKDFRQRVPTKQKGGGSNDAQASKYVVPALQMNARVAIPKKKTAGPVRNDENMSPLSNKRKRRVSFALPQ